MFRRRKRGATTEEELLRRLECRGLKAFIVLPSAEAPFIHYKRSPGGGCYPAQSGQQTKGEPA